MASDRRSSTVPPEGRRVESVEEAIAVPVGGPEMDRCVSYLRALLPHEGFGIRFLLADHRGYLRVLHCGGHPLRLGRRQAVGRRGTLADGVIRILEHADGRAVGLFPIDRRGPALGVAEVSATITSLTTHRRDVEAAIGRVSEGLYLGTQRELRRKELDIGLAWTAHELRGPLHAARLWLENAAATSDGHKADHIARAIEELSRLAEGMESVLRWAVGDGDLRCRRVDLVSLTHEAVDCCMAETGQDRVLVEGRERLAVRADALHLRSAIENLVRNALRYSTPGTKVRVIVETRDGEPTVEVDNEGPEVPESERGTIFEPLAHVANGGGTGVGLFVVRRIVERHGGTIRCYHPAEGHVAFELRLPGEAAA